MSHVLEFLTCLNCGLLIANLAVLGLTLKLYTEFYKERVKGK